MKKYRVTHNCLLLTQPCSTAIGLQTENYVAIDWAAAAHSKSDGFFVCKLTGYRVRADLVFETAETMLHLLGSGESVPSLSLDTVGLTSDALKPHPMDTLPLAIDTRCDDTPSRKAAH